MRSSHRCARAFVFGLITLWLSLLLLIWEPGTLVTAASGSTVRILASDTNHVILELELSGYQARDKVLAGRTFSVLSFPDSGYVAEPGKPQLPVRGVMIGIPPRAQVSISVLADDSRRDILAHPPAPAASTQVQTVWAEPPRRNTRTTYSPNAVAYSSSQPYPKDAAGIASTGALRSQQFAVIEFHPLQYYGSTQQLLFHKRLRVEVKFNYPGGARADAQGGAMNEGPFETVLQRSLANYDTAKTWRTRVPVLSRASGVRTGVYSTGPWYRVEIQDWKDSVTGEDGEGIYQITCSDLAAAGINLGSLAPGTLQVFKWGTEVAIDVVGASWSPCDPSASYLEFFARGLNTKYSKNNIYWLTYGKASHKIMTLRDGSGLGLAPTTATSFTDTLHVEQDNQYVAETPYIAVTTPLVDDFDHWVWNGVSAFYGIPSRDYTFALDANHISGGAFSAVLQADLVGYNTGSHHTLISVNPSNGYPAIDDTTWNGLVERNVSITFPQSYLQGGNNTIRVNEPDNTDPTHDAVFTNYFDLSYQAAFNTTNDNLRFRQAVDGVWKYPVAGFSNSNIETFDVTVPDSVVRITNTTITPIGGTYTVEFVDSMAAPREYIAVTAGKRKSPMSITLDTPSDLLGTTIGKDYMIISASEFKSLGSLANLVNQRRSQGLRVPDVIDVQDVYDEFNDGVMSPQAIRDFLASVYNLSPQPKPSFVLLVGDGNYDFKHNYYTQPNWVPPYLGMFDPWMGEVPSDNRYVAFHDRDTTPNRLPNMAIGRLPAQSAADVDAMVNKILNNENSAPPGAWRTKITFAADTAYNSYGSPDEAGDFWTYSDQIAGDTNYIPAPYVADRIYYNTCPPTYEQCNLPYPSYPSADSVRTGLVGAINEGRLIVNYVGHGSELYWANDQIYRIDEVNSLQNTIFPVMLEMTCNTGSFQKPGLTALAEAEMRASNKGALASWAASGWGLVSGHDLLEKGFYQSLAWQGQRRLGYATNAGKSFLWANSGGFHLDLIDTFNLFGDPASLLNAPPLSKVYLPFIAR